MLVRMVSVFEGVEAEAFGVAGADEAEQITGFEVAQGAGDGGAGCADG